MRKCVPLRYRMRPDVAPHSKCGRVADKAHRTLGRNRGHVRLDVSDMPRTLIGSAPQRSLTAGPKSSNPLSSSGESTNFRFLFAPHAHLSAARRPHGGEAKPSTFIQGIETVAQADAWRGRDRREVAMLVMNAILGVVIMGIRCGRSHFI
jgi:hypothetical protein